MCSAVFQLPRFSKEPFQKEQASTKINVSSEPACFLICTLPVFIKQEIEF